MKRLWLRLTKPLKTPLERFFGLLFWLCSPVFLFLLLAVTFGSLSFEELFEFDKYQPRIPPAVLFLFWLASICFVFSYLGGIAEKVDQWNLRTFFSSYEHRLDYIKHLEPQRDLELEKTSYVSYATPYLPLLNTLSGFSEQELQQHFCTELHLKYGSPAYYAFDRYFSGQRILVKRILPKIVELLTK